MDSQKRALARTVASVVWGSVDGMTQAVEEPRHPICDVDRATLGLFKLIVISPALLPDLTRHTIEALRTAFRPSKTYICDGAREAAVSIVERMNCHEPEMG